MGPRDERSGRDDSKNDVDMTSSPSSPKSPVPRRSSSNALKDAMSLVPRLLVRQFSRTDIKDNKDVIGSNPDSPKSASPKSPSLSKDKSSGSIAPPNSPRSTIIPLTPEDRFVLLLMKTTKDASDAVDPLVKKSDFSNITKRIEEFSKLIKLIEKVKTRAISLIVVNPPQKVDVLPDGVLEYLKVEFPGTVFYHLPNQLVELTKQFAINNATYIEDTVKKVEARKVEDTVKKAEARKAELQSETMDVTAVTSYVPAASGIQMSPPTEIPPLELANRRNPMFSEFSTDYREPAPHISASLSSSASSVSSALASSFDGFSPSSLEKRIPPGESNSLKRKESYPYLSDQLSAVHLESSSGSNNSGSIARRTTDSPRAQLSKSDHSKSAPNLDHAAASFTPFNASLSTSLDSKQKPMAKPKVMQRFQSQAAFFIPAAAETGDLTSQNIHTIMTALMVDHRELYTKLYNIYPLSDQEKTICRAKKLIGENEELHPLVTEYIFNLKVSRIRR